MVRKRAAIFLSELHIIILCGVLVGAFSYEFAKDALPCPLCLLQRFGMLAMALCPTYNLLFGFNPTHFAFGIWTAIFSAGVSARQILLHISLNFPTFGLPVFGYELYTWAFIVAVCSMLGSGLVLLLYHPCDEFHKVEKLTPIGIFAISLLLFLTLATMITSFVECGLWFCPDNPVHDVY